MKEITMPSSSQIVIGSPVYAEGRYTIPFSVPAELKKFFKGSSFWFECPDAGKVPESIAEVTVVANLISFAWVFDCTLTVDALDDAYCKALPQIKQGYIDMLPDINLKGGLDVKHAIPCEKHDAPGFPLQLFSGGVDAWCTLIRHIDERPRLVTVWGADIGVDNEDGWRIVNSNSKKVAADLDLPCSYVKSSLRGIFDYQALNEYLAKVGTSYEWWHDLQHGMGFLGLVTPLAFATNAPTIYIASTYSAEDVGAYTCASDPKIDDKFAAGVTKGKHDGFELLRQDKVDRIVEFAERSQANVNLRVCFHVASGDNCCRCEKCGRTILGIYAAGGDPRHFGFSFSPLKLRILAFRMRYFYVMEPPYYKRMREDAARCQSTVPSCFNWFFKGTLEDVCSNGFKQRWKRFHAFGAQLYHKLIG